MLMNRFARIIFFFLFFLFVIARTKAYAATSIYNLQPTILTPTTATISWLSSSAEDSKINYGTTLSYGSSATDATVTVSHSVSLTRLIPGTTYHYTVGNISGSDVSADTTFKTPYDWGIITSNPNTGVDTSHLADESSKGIKIKTLELVWSSYEPGNGTFNSTYIAAKKAELATYQAQGFKVVLDIGSPLTASWITNLDANTLLKNQYGDSYAPGEVGKNIVNAVFNNTVRSALSVYIQRIFQDLGTNFYAVRAGGGWYGELHYPVQSYNGRTNSYWGYDANAQGTGGNLPTGVNVNPVPGWIPNPVRNGTFENGVDGSWTLAASDSLVTGGAHRGTKALQKVNPGALTNQTQQTISVVAGRKYNYSFWAKTSDATFTTSPCLQIIKTSDSSQIVLKCINSTTYAEGSGSFTPTENTVKLALLTNDGGNATLTFDDVSIMADGYTYDATNANALSFWNWYRDSLINYQNWQIAQYRTAGFNGRIFMLYPSFGVRPDATVNQVTQAIGYDLSMTSSPSINGELQQDSDFYDEIAGLVDSQNNVYPYCTWLEASTANDANADKGAWSPAKYISTLATNNNRIAYGENAGSNNYTEMQRMVSMISANHLAGGFWMCESQLYGGTYATAANYQTQIAASDGTGPYNLSLAINPGGSFASQSIPLTISATDNVSPVSGLQMIIGNDSSFTGSSWQSYKTSTSYSLPIGNSNRTIYLEVKDAVGNTSNVYTTSFSLPSSPSSLSQYKSDGSTSLHTGETTGENSVVLKFKMSSPNSSDSLTPQVELRAVGENFGNTVTHSGNAVSYAGSPVTGTVTVTGLGAGKNYHWQARVSNAAGGSSWVSYGGNSEASSDFGVAAKRKNCFFGIFCW